MDQKTLDALRELAGGIGQTVEKLWPMAVQVIFARGVSLAVLLIALMIVATVSFRWSFTSKFKDEKGSEEPLFAWRMISIGVFVIALICLCEHALPMILAPEGSALFKLLGK